MAGNLAVDNPIVNFTFEEPARYQAYKNGKSVLKGAGRLYLYGAAAVMVERNAGNREGTG